MTRLYSPAKFTTATRAVQSAAVAEGRDHFLYCMWTGAYLVSPEYSEVLDPIAVSNMMDGHKRPNYNPDGQRRR